VRATSPTITTPTITTSATVPLLIGGTGTTSTLALRSTSGVGTTGADIIFQVGNNGATEAMRVLNSGFVGIGTNAPSQKLTIGAGDFQIDNAQYVRGKIAAGTTTRMLGINASNNLYVGSVDAALTGILFNVNGTTYAQFDASGNLGVGTASPGVKLDVSGAAKANYAIASGPLAAYASSSGGLYSYFTASAGTLNAVTDNSGTAGTLILATGSERMRITSIGIVAINTTTPLANNRLHVEQNANANYSTSFAPGTTPTQLVLRDISDVATYTNPFAAVQFGAGNTGAGWSYVAGAREGSGTSFLAFGTGTGGQATERMRINSTGNLLIGGASPIGSSRVELLGTNDATSTISLYRSDLAQRTIIGAQYIGSFTNNSFDVYTNSTQKMRLAASGQLLLGTSTGSAIAQNYIDVNGTANCALVLKATDVVQGYVYADDASNELRLSATGTGNINALTFHAGGSERARITSAGVVNIPNLTASQAVFTDASDNLVSNAITGSGSVVMSTSPTLVTPILGTPTSGTLTSCTGLPLTTGVTGTLPVANGGTGITSLGTGIATWLGTPSSANLLAAMTDETGTGALVFGTSYPNVHNLCYLPAAYRRHSHDQHAHPALDLWRGHHRRRHHLSGGQ
jgi:hypothetical protein